MGDSTRSLLAILGYLPGDCGYCKGEDTSQRTPNSRAQYYVRSSRLTVEDYQALVDRGWRRSGSLLYKPDVLRACCPHYAIRIPAALLKPSRDQRHAVNKWNTYVLGKDYFSELAKRYPKTKEEKKRQKEGFDLIQAVHEAEVPYLKPIDPEHKFEITLEPASFTEEKFKLFENFQRNVHKEGPSSITRPDFRRFLCDSPLVRSELEVDGVTKRLGSYHQCYRLDGRLIAMGVLDLLPAAVSAVYFLYHDDYARWSFGKLSALREAALAIEGNYEYYYMGYYIHTCPKMQYKGDYKPQYALDPISYAWHPLDEMRSHLDKQGFVSLDAMRDGEKMAGVATTIGSDQGPPAKMETTSDDEDEFIGPDGGKWLFKDPAEAAHSGESLFDIRMPGVMTEDEVKAAVDVDEIPLSFGRDRIFTAGVLAQHYQNVDTLKESIAQLVACIGPEVANRIMIDFGQQNDPE